jgi:hypothetical protein
MLQLVEYLLVTGIAPSAVERMRASVSSDDVQTLAKFLAATAQKRSGRRRLLDPGWQGGGASTHSLGFKTLDAVRCRWRN